MLIVIDEARGLALNPDDISTMVRVDLRAARATPEGDREVVPALVVRMKTGEQVVVDGSSKVIEKLHVRLLEAQ